MSVEDFDEVNLRAGKNISENNSSKRMRMMIKTFLIALHYYH